LPRNQLVPTRRSTLAMTRAERALVRRAADIQAELFYARAVDVARRERATGRMSDIGLATRHALDEGTAIADDLAERTARNPWAAQALSGIAEDGIRGLRQELRNLQED
jgi:hypothetical protein